MKKRTERSGIFQNGFSICEITGWRGESRAGVHRVEEIFFSRKKENETPLGCLVNFKSREVIGKPIRLWRRPFVFIEIIEYRKGKRIGLKPLCEIGTGIDGEKPLPLSDIFTLLRPFAALGVEDFVGAVGSAPEGFLENERWVGGCIQNQLVGKELGDFQSLRGFLRKKNDDPDSEENSRCCYEKSFFHGNEMLLLISRIRVSSQEELDVAYGIDEAVEAILFIIEEGIGGDHDFPIRIPGTAPDEARVGELSRHRAVEVGGIIHGTEGLVFPGDPEFFVQCPAGSEDLASGECRRAHIFRQGKRLVAHGPRTKRVLVAERGNTHHIHTSRNEINIRRRADRIGI